MPAFPQLSARAARLTLGFAALGALGTDLSAQALDRTKRPTPAEQPALTFPAITVRKLANGIEVAVMRDTRLPVVSVQAVLDISSAVDPLDKTGLGGFMQGMLDEGTTSRTADQIAIASAALGGGVSATGVYTITANLDSALALMADQLLHPSFPEPALERLKANALAGLQRQKESPNYLANTVYRRLVYGVDHPYSREQTEASVQAISRDDLVTFHARYVRPPNMRFVVVGDITPDEAVAKLKPYFEGLQAGTVGRIDIPTPAGPGPAKVYLYDRPGSPQSIFMIGTLGPRRDTPDYQAIRVMNSILGGAFSSRINLNLRERHGYTYGARTGFNFRRVPEVGGFSASADVQANKTDSAAIEFMRELREIRDSRPITDDEFQFARDQLTKQLPLQFETIQARASAITTLLLNNLPLNYYETLSAEIAAVTREQAESTAQKYITPDQFAIVVVGDRKMIEPGLRAANLAPVVVVDLDGKPVAP